MAAKNAKDSGAKKMLKALRIVSAREGFRRADRAWTVQATTVRVSEFSDEDIAMLKGESMLTVEEIEIPDESGTDAADAKATAEAEAQAAAEAQAIADAQALADAANKDA